MSTTTTSYIVKLIGCRTDGRDVSGEYDGGGTIDTAQREGSFFNAHTTDGAILICVPVNDGDALRVVDVVRG